MWSFVIVFIAFIGELKGHGTLDQPPSRGSAWRFGFNTPANYNDNQLYCGGRAVQWDQNGGRCGVCGDPYQGPREHEAGGRYATGTIVRSYTTGQRITVKITLTANHLGWMEFRLCPVNNHRRKASQACLDRHLLRLADGSGTRFTVTADLRSVRIDLMLPHDLECSQCVMQWKYNTGNNYGTDRRSGRDCLGCGPQEQFYACADVSISRSPSNNQETNDNQGSKPGPSTGQRVCKALLEWAHIDGLDLWCAESCANENCPASHCIC